MVIVCNLKNQCAVGMFITCNQKQNWLYHHKCTTVIDFSPHYCVDQVMVRVLLRRRDLKMRNGVTKII